MKKSGGDIVNIGLGWGSKGYPKAAAYCAAKGGVVNLTRAMAIDHGGDNIRVNCTCLGDLDIHRLQGEVARLAVLEKIAGLLVFLSSTEASFITGQVITIDGW